MEERSCLWEQMGKGLGSGAAVVLKTEKKREKKKKEKNKQKNGGMDHLGFFSWLESQSRPSYRPSPLVAQVAWMYQLRWRRACKPSFSVISAAFIALGRSCGRIQRDGV